MISQPWLSSYLVYSYLLLLNLSKTNILGQICPTLIRGRQNPSKIHEYCPKFYKNVKFLAFFVKCSFQWYF